MAVDSLRETVDDRLGVDATADQLIGKHAAAEFNHKYTIYNIPHLPSRNESNTSRRTSNERECAAVAPKARSLPGQGMG